MATLGVYNVTVPPGKHGFGQTSHRWFLLTRAILSARADVLVRLCNIDGWRLGLEVLVRLCNIDGVGRGVDLSDGGALTCSAF